MVNKPLLLKPRCPDLMEYSTVSVHPPDSAVKMFPLKTDVVQHVRQQRERMAGLLAPVPPSLPPSSPAHTPPSA